MVLSQQNINKNTSYNPISGSTLNCAGVSKSSKSAQLLMQELTRAQSFQPLPQNNDLFGIPKSENLTSSNIYNPNFLYFTDTENISSKLKASNTCTKFPDDFNPRKELNMPHKQKVEKWIVKVPVQPTDLTLNTWDNYCYDPMIPTTDESEDSDDCSEVNFSRSDDIIDYQSKMITFITNKNYFVNSENIRKFDGKLVPGGIEYGTYGNTLDYGNFHPMSEYDHYESFNVHR